MRKFVAFLSNKDKELFNDELLKGHIDHLSSLHQQGKLQLCGPFTDNDSAIQIIVAENIDEANSLVANDPFIKMGYYRTVDVKELIEANSENNWLMSHPQTEEKRQ